MWNPETPLTERQVLFLETSSSIKATSLETESCQMSQDGKINGGAKVKVLEGNMFSTARQHGQTIWPLEMKSLPLRIY